jgi:predicted ATP-dependent Lon-type protease
MNKSFNRLPWLSPMDEAEIALKALKTGDFKNIAKEYNTNINNVLRLRCILEENAADLFLHGIEEKCLYELIDQFRCQIDIIEGIVNEITEVLGMKRGKYFAE